MNPVPPFSSFLCGRSRYSLDIWSLMTTFYANMQCMVKAKPTSAKKLVDATKRRIITLWALLQAQSAATQKYFARLNAAGKAYLGVLVWGWDETFQYMQESAIRNKALKQFIDNADLLIRPCGQKATATQLNPKKKWCKLANCTLLGQTPLAT